MPLTLTITDPHLLTEAERMAVLTFCQISGKPRDLEKIARSEPRDSVREMIAVAHAGERIDLRESTGDPTSRGEVRIDPLDDPSVGIVAVPPVPTKTVALDQYNTIDPATLFGGAHAAPGVPVPPVPGAAILSAPVVAGLPPAPVPGASVPPAGASDQLPPAAPPNPTNALDSAGMPWDHRIHATTKTKNADGTWRAKRGVDAKLVEDVLAQNQRLMAIAPPAVPAAPTAVPGAPAPDTAPSGMTFADLMEGVIKLINSGKISLEAANAACMPIGVTYLHQLDKRPDLIASAWAHLQHAAGVA